MNFTQSCADFVATLVFADLKPRSVDAAIMGFSDCVGVMIAGAGEDAVRLVSAACNFSDAPLSAPDVVSGRLLDAPDAALINGTAAHALDYDDVALAAHPSAVLVPAILAAGWALSSSGSTAIEAYIAGYEVWAQIFALQSGNLHERGFHPTSVLGPVAAAVACAKLHGLDAGKTAHALSIAASLGGGLIANFGTMAKPLHVGRAAQAGVLAARLAASGFTASSNALEHPKGFLQAYSCGGVPTIADGTIDLGTRWRSSELGVNVKRYPTCYATHRAIDAMLHLVRIHAIAPDDVAEIRVRTGTTQMMMLKHFQPKDALEAKFSMNFAMASALVAREVGLLQLTDDFVRRKDVLRAEAKVVCTTTDDLSGGTQPFAPDDRVALTLSDGRVIEHPPVVHAKGSWEMPLHRSELREKFLDCSKSVLGLDHATVLFEQLGKLDTLGSLRDLWRAFGQAGPSIDVKVKA